MAKQPCEFGHHMRRAWKWSWRTAASTPCSGWRTPGEAFTMPMTVTRPVKTDHRQDSPHRMLSCSSGKDVWPLSNTSHHGQASCLDQRIHAHASATGRAGRLRILSCNALALARPQVWSVPARHAGAWRALPAEPCHRGRPPPAAPRPLRSPGGTRGSCGDVDVVLPQSCICMHACTGLDLHVPQRCGRTTRARTRYALTGSLLRHPIPSPGVSPSGPSSRPLVRPQRARAMPRLPRHHPHQAWPGLACPS